MVTFGVGQTEELDVYSDGDRLQVRGAMNIDGNLTGQTIQAIFFCDGGNGE